MKTYYHKVIDASLPAPVLERKLNRYAKMGYSIMAVSTNGSLIIMAKERE